jgi:hypothetical protein
MQVRAGVILQVQEVVMYFRLVLFGIFWLGVGAMLFFVAPKMGWISDVASPYVGLGWILVGAAFMGVIQSFPDEGDDSNF